MQSPSRRALLSALATLPLSACLGGDGSGTATPATATERPTDGTQSPTSSPTTSAKPVVREPGTAYETDEFAVTVSDLAVRHGMVTFGSVHPDPLWESGAQFLLATVSVTGEVDPANLRVTATADTLSERPDRYYGFAPDASASVQPLGFVVPTDPAPTEAAVVWHGPRTVRWPVPDELVRALGRAPDFSLKDVSVPESARPGGTLDVTFTVANDGARDGRFLAELGNAAMSDQPEIELAVPAGETVTATRSVEARFVEGELTVRFQWEGGVQRYTVAKA